MHLSERDKQTIVEILKDRLNPKFIYLFGTFANKLSFDLKREVQLVNLRDIDTVFAAQIVGTIDV